MMRKKPSCYNETVNVNDCSNMNRILIGHSDDRRLIVMVGLGLTFEVDLCL